MICVRAKEGPVDVRYAWYTQVDCGSNGVGCVRLQNADVMVLDESQEFEKFSKPAQNMESTLDETRGPADVRYKTAIMF